MIFLNKINLTILIAFIIFSVTNSNANQQVLINEIPATELPKFDFSENILPELNSKGQETVNSPGFGDDVGDVPINDGIWILMFAGISYAIIQLKPKKMNLK
ncbi:MAG: hypothetical protein RI934_76 [Bacteroidota bacterium]|jgi:hypothetical protein